MSADDQFRNVDWEDVLKRLTLRARQLFAAARAKGFGNALARACVEPDGLARDVYIAALQYQRVKYKPEKGASLVTFLLQVLERDFIDLVRKGMRLDKRLVAVDTTEDRDLDLPRHPGVVTDVADHGDAGRIMELRAAALHAAKGKPDLEDYITAAFDCGASKRSDQATLLGVSVKEITNRRKKMLRLLSPVASETPGGEPGGEQ
jgi:DNA-directed RNA polymerase specialized sigma24 family protein